MLYVSAPAPPLAAPLPLYAVPVVALVGIVPVKVMGGAALTTRSKEAVAVRALGFPESVTLRLKAAVPAQEAISPLELEIKPAEVIVMQEGRVPLVSVHVYGEMPPLAASCSE
jgi:hypothetical protein